MGLTSVTLLRRARRELVRSRRSLEAVGFKETPASTELIPFVVNIPRVSFPPWLREEEIELAVRQAVTDAVMRLGQRLVTPGQLLARKNVSAELRSQAARSMLAMRGGKATAAKMRDLGYPNLVKAREALKRKRPRGAA